MRWREQGPPARRERGKGAGSSAMPVSHKKWGAEWSAGPRHRQDTPLSTSQLPAPGHPPCAAHGRGRRTRAPPGGRCLAPPHPAARGLRGNEKRNKGKCTAAVARGREGGSSAWRRTTARRVLLCRMQCTISGAMLTGVRLVAEAHHIAVHAHLDLALHAEMIIHWCGLPTGCCPPASGPMRHWAVRFCVTISPCPPFLVHSRDVGTKHILLLPLDEVHGDAPGAAEGARGRGADHAWAMGLWLHNSSSQAMAGLATSGTPEEQQGTDLV